MFTSLSFKFKQTKNKLANGTANVTPATLALTCLSKLDKFDDIMQFYECNNYSILPFDET